MQQLPPPPPQSKPFADTWASHLKGPGALYIGKVLPGWGVGRTRKFFQPGKLLGPPSPLFGALAATAGKAEEDLGRKGRTASQGKEEDWWALVCPQLCLSPRGSLEQVSTPLVGLGLSTCIMGD